MMDGDTKTAVYSPPRPGLPYLLVTIKDGEIVSTMPVRSRDEARRIMIEPPRPSLRGVASPTA